jgi:multiple sugar transport system permease protein
MDRAAASERRQAYAMVAPAILVLLVVAAYPILAAIWLSLHRLIVVFHDWKFILFRNYLFLLGDQRFWTALGNTSYFTLVSVSVELFLGLLFAMLLNAGLPGRGTLRAIVLIPWAIPTVISAKLWAWFFAADAGPAAGILSSPGVSWLGTPGYAMHAAILVDVWKTTPFVALLLLAGLQAIPEDAYEAARVDGATNWKIFTSITLPLLRPMILIALLFRTLDAFRIFDAVFVLTEGGPANTTETLSIYTYKTLMRSGDFGYGSTLSVAVFLCAMLISLGYLTVFRRVMGIRR